MKRKRSRRRRVRSCNVAQGIFFIYSLRLNDPEPSDLYNTSALTEGKGHRMQDFKEIASSIKSLPEVCRGD
jgi:hypothetical protein